MQRHPFIIDTSSNCEAEGPWPMTAAAAVCAADASGVMTPVVFPKFRFPILPLQKVKAYTMHAVENRNTQTPYAVHPKQMRLASPAPAPQHEADRDAVAQIMCDFGTKAVYGIPIQTKFSITPISSIDSKRNNLHRIVRYALMAGVLPLPYYSHASPEKCADAFIMCFLHGVPISGLPIPHGAREELLREAVRGGRERGGGLLLHELVRQWFFNVNAGSDICIRRCFRSYITRLMYNKNYSRKQACTVFLRMVRHQREGTSKLVFPLCIQNCIAVIRLLQQEIGSDAAITHGALKSLAMGV